LVKDVITGFLRLIYHNLRDVPHTLKFNFRYFPLKEALLFPVIISRHIKFLKLEGSLTVTAPVKYGMIRIGFGNVGLFDKKSAKGTWENYGRVIFNGPASIGHGSKIIVGQNGTLTLGKNFTVMAESSFVCYKEISFGNDCLISWDVLFLDTDFHSIIANDTQKRLNPDAPIRIGNRNWIGCRCLILKGSETADHSVIGANTTLTRKINDVNVVIAGNPPSLIKTNISWQ